MLFCELNEWNKHKQLKHVAHTHTHLFLVVENGANVEGIGWSIDSIGLLDSHSKTTILARRVVWDINSTVRIQRNHQLLQISQDRNDPCKKHNPSLTGTVIFAQTLFMLGHYGLLHPRSCWHACVSPWFSMTYEAKDRMSKLEMTKQSQEYCTVCRYVCLS